MLTIDELTREKSIQNESLIEKNTKNCYCLFLLLEIATL